MRLLIRVDVTKKNNNAILVTLLEYFVYILVCKCLFCLFLYDGVLLREEASSMNPFPLTVIQLSIQQCKWKVDINRIFIFDACLSSPWIKYIVSNI